VNKKEIVKEYDSYNTNLTPQDIVLAFPGNVFSYLKEAKYFLCDYTIYQGEKDQNYAWCFKIIKETYKWGTVYTLQLHISNGIFSIGTSTSNFNEDGKSADFAYGFPGDAGESIVHKFKSFVQEAMITLKRCNRHFDIESQKALAYVINAFIDELSTTRKGEREAERKIENEMAEREAYLAAMRRAMRRGWDD
jgi:hypothetical protein